MLQKKQSNTQRNRSLTHWSREKYTHHRRVRKFQRRSAKFLSCTRPSRHYGSETVSASRTSEEKKRALTACLGKRDCASLLEVNKCFRRATQKYWRTTANNHWHNEPTISAVSFKQSRKRTRGSCNSRSWRSLECCASWLLLQPASLA